MEVTKMKIGIITLHRIPNYGSALQAYALQKYIEKEGLGEVELIDYVYPNSFHKSKTTFEAWLRNLYCVEIRDKYLRRGWKKSIAFKKFYRKFYHLSSKQFHSVEDIMNDPPDYDLYITGSDQLWNVNTLRNDPVMYCEFAPLGKRRVSFGASFTIKTLPEEYKGSVRERLNKYKYIGVREYSSLSILESLNLNDCIIKFNTCDPTLLLNKNDYEELSEFSSIRIDGDYILVYPLKYAYNPEPALCSVVQQVREELGCKLIVIDSHKVSLRKGDKIISGIGPCEFCWLFAHAKYVVASSFHGTMFSLINRVPFTVIGPEEKSEDRRIADVLEFLGLGSNIVPANKKNVNVVTVNPFNESSENKINDFINKSKDFLIKSIKEG